MTNLIAPDSLIGMALSDAEAAAVESSFDEDGYQDTLECDYALDQHGYLERIVAEHADVVAVFAQEVLRWS